MLPCLAFLSISMDDLSHVGTVYMIPCQYSHYGVQGQFAEVEWNGDQNDLNKDHHSIQHHHIILETGVV